MKYMIASDIHGSSYFCDLMLKAFEKEKAERLILLGDILYHGPRNDLPKEYAPKEVIKMLNNVKSKILCVRGNCEAEVDQMVLEFPCMADYAVIPIDKNIIYATHGHLYNENNLPPLNKGDILLNGHTHIPRLTIGDTYTYMNPGSISIPKDGSVHSYMILEDRRFSWVNLENDETYKACEV